MSADQISEYDRQAEIAERVTNDRHQTLAWDGAAPRPVESREQRMRAATADDRPATMCQRVDFATYLDRHERDHLDAKVGRLQGELDEMRDARDTAKQLADIRKDTIDRLRAELADAGDVIAAIREAAERLDRGLASWNLLDVHTAVEHIDRALAAYDTTPQRGQTATLGSPEARAQDKQADVYLRIGQAFDRVMAPYAEQLRRLAGREG